VQNGALLTNGLVYLLMSDIKMFEICHFISHWTAEELATALS